jgi:hypothetical protein
VVRDRGNLLYELSIGHAAIPTVRFLRAVRTIQAYRSAVERKLKVFTSRENVALSREALRGVLADGNLILRPDVANARLEGTLTISREEFIQEKQIDIKMVAGAGCGLRLAFPGRCA